MSQFKIHQLKFFCPYIECNNRKSLYAIEVWIHLSNQGFWLTYFVLFFHGENAYILSSSSKIMTESSEQPTLPSEMLDIVNMVTNAYRQICHHVCEVVILVNKKI